MSGDGQTMIGRISSIISDGEQDMDLDAISGTDRETPDREIVRMSVIVGLLDGTDQAARGRIMRYLIDRYPA